jgi:DNA modification methylase
MAIPAYSSQSHVDVPVSFGGTQLELLSPIWNTPHSDREASGTFALSFSPQLVRHMIHTYSKPGDTVLDCFVGTGTTVIESQLMGRRSIGIDCNEAMLGNTLDRLPIASADLLPTLYSCDARNMQSVLDDESVDFVITQPPYGSTHKFSKNNPQDLSLLSPNEFLKGIEQVAAELFRVVKPGGHIVLLIGDTKDRGRMMPLGFQFMHRFLSRGFSVKQTFDFRSPVAQLPVPLHDHEYLFIFQKKEKAPKRPRPAF